MSTRELLATWGTLWRGAVWIVWQGLYGKEDE